MRTLCSLCLIFLAFLPAQTDSDSLFVIGNQLFSEEKYEEAAQVYERILKSAEHSNLYYNLGNAYYRSGDIGLAIWAYEKGKILSPRHKDIRYNLSIVNTYVKDRIESPKGFFLIELYRSFMERVTIIDLLGAGGVGLVILVLLSIMRNKLNLREKILTPLLTLSILAIILLHIFALDKYWELTDKVKGVVVRPLADIRSAPVTRGENIIFRVHEGAIVDIIQSQPGWAEIILLDGKQGWIEYHNIREL